MDSLLQAGAKVNISSCVGGLNLLQEAASSYIPRDRGFSAAMLRKILDAGADTNSLSLLSGTSPLTYAVIANNHESVVFLLEQGALIDQLDFDGDNAICNAFPHGSYECLELLLQRGADHKTINKQGWTILHTVAALGDIRAITILMQFKLPGLNADAREKKGKTARQLLDQRPFIPVGLTEAFEQLLRHVREPRQEESEVFVDAPKFPST